MKYLLVLIPIATLFIACAQAKPQASHEVLEADIEKLMALNESYQSKEIDAMTYLKKFRALNKKIKYEEEMNGGGHTHTH